MARVYVDHREVVLPTPEVVSLDDILKYVEESHLPPNTLIRQVQVDGLPLASEEFQRHPENILERIADRDRVEISTGTVWEVARDSIREAIQYLKRVDSVTPDLASSFRATPGPEAFEQLRQFYEGFYWLNMLLDRLQSTFQISLETVHVGGATVRHHHLNLVSILKELIGAQEREDFVLLADLLEYEIHPLIPLWRDAFSMIGEGIVSK